jgi:hypothetical protein
VAIALCVHLGLRLRYIILSIYGPRAVSVQVCTQTIGLVSRVSASANPDLSATCRASSHPFFFTSSVAAVAIFIIIVVVLLPLQGPGPPT